MSDTLAMRPVFDARALRKGDKVLVCVAVGGTAYSMTGIKMGVVVDEVAEVLVVANRVQLPETWALAEAPVPDGTYAAFRSENGQVYFPGFEEAFFFAEALTEPVPDGQPRPGLDAAPEVKYLPPADETSAGSEPAEEEKHDA